MQKIKNNLKQENLTDLKELSTKMLKSYPLKNKKIQQKKLKSKSILNLPCFFNHSSHHLPPVHVLRVFPETPCPWCDVSPLLWNS